MNYGWIYRLMRSLLSAWNFGTETTNADLSLQRMSKCVHCCSTALLWHFAQAPRGRNSLGLGRIELF